eukprot:13504-Heterococcus_DN1.PRE.1
MSCLVSVYTAGALHEVAWSWTGCSHKLVLVNSSRVIRVGATDLRLGFVQLSALALAHKHQPSVIRRDYLKQCYDIKYQQSKATTTK